MIKINRGNKPALNPESDCLNGQNKEILKNQLSEDTNDACAFCCESDISTSTGQVEHFLPEKHFPSKRCEWENLFWACEKCNKTKIHRYYGQGEDGTSGSLHYKPLKFDAPDYRFADWFYLDTFTGDIKALHEDIDGTKYQREYTTIKLFGLNKSPRSLIRRRELNAFKQHPAQIAHGKYRKLILHIMQ